MEEILKEIKDLQLDLKSLEEFLDSGYSILINDPDFRNEMIRNDIESIEEIKIKLRDLKIYYLIKKNIPK